MHQSIDDAVDAVAEHAVAFDAVFGRLLRIFRFLGRWRRLVELHAERWRWPKRRRFERQ
jgi:hypothetical protein